MIKSGIPIAEAFEIIHDQTKSPAFEKVLQKITQDIKNGQTLAESLKKHPRVFDQLYVSMIEIGEESGTLEKTLEYLSDQQEKDYDLQQKIKTAMLYPGLVLAATTIMGGFMSFYILPKLVDFFEAFDTDLPITTQILLWFATIMKNYGVVIVISIVILAIGFSSLLKLKSVKPVWHRFILRIPLIGPFIVNGQLARFSRNLSILLKSGVPISRSLEVTAYSLSNITYQKDLLVINQSLSKGKNISDALSNPRFKHFPGIVQKMINVGEKTGQLEDTLLYLADFYEDEIDAQSKRLSTILEPLLLLGIGLVVGFIALAIISPIYELTGSIRR
jgi:type IV pilus assembly protein PilC